MSKYEKEQARLYNMRRRKYKTHKFKPAKVLSTKNITGPKTVKEIYRDFLFSREWREIRKKILKEQPHCCLCNETRELQLHHISYEHAYAPYDEARKEIVVLCREHHQMFHVRYGVNSKMLIQWAEFKSEHESLKTKNIYV